MRKKSLIFCLLVLMAFSTCAQEVYTMPSNGTNTITACSGTVLDPGGTGNYPSNCNGYLIINPAIPGCKVRLTGSYNTEGSYQVYDYFRVYNGTTTSGTELGYFYGSGTCDVTSTSGPLLIYFHSDGSVQYSGFELNISCSGGCTCSIPVFTSTTIGDHTVSLSWSSSSLANGYILEYGPHGFTLGSGTQLYLTTTSYTINNLNNGVEYDFYLWLDCGNDQTITDETPAMVSATPNNQYIMSESYASVTSCNMLIYDNGGPSGNYSSYSDNTLVIYPSTSGCVVSLTGTYNTESPTYDYIKVYNGAGTSGTLLATLGGSNGTISNPIISTASSGALTILFHSDGYIQKSGYELIAKCICDMDTTCVGTHYQGYGFDTVFTNTGIYVLSRTDPDGTLVSIGVLVQNKPYVSISGEHYFCALDSITLTANTAETYLWSTGDTSQSITVQDIGNYSVTITDNRGCTASTHHKIAPIEEFISSINFPVMCAGNDYLITGSYNSGSEIEMFMVQSTLSIADTAFLPDGVPCEPYGCAYRSTLTFTDYSEDAVVESVDDIYYVKINMEHSYIGDIYINITCPNGQKADILKWSGYGNNTACSSQIPVSSIGWDLSESTNGAADFGVVHTGSSSSFPCDMTVSSNAPGTGWNYCWSNNSTQGYTYAAGGGLVYQSVNIHNGRIDSSNVSAGTQFYHPDEAFESLIGCPLNGAWYIEVMDGYGIDNGYIFGWELALTDEIFTNSSFDVSSIIPDAPWTMTVNDTSFIMSPPDSLPQDTTINFVLHFYNTDECAFDSTVQVNVIAAYHADTTVMACESFTWHDENYTQSGDYTLSYTSSAGCDSTLTLHLTVNYNVQNSDTLVLVQNQLPYYFEPADTTFSLESPEQFQFTYVLPDQYQCDSLVIQTVLVYENTSQSFDTTVCSNDLPFTWHGHTFTEAGDAVDTLITVNGSDSVVIYHLSVDMFSAVPYNVTMVICHGGSDGGAEVLADLGQLPYAYLWTDSEGTTVSTDMQMSNVPVGTYFFTVTDAIGCISSDSIVIQATYPPLDAGTISASQSICIGGDLQPFTGTPASGFSNIDYQWQISYDGMDWQAAPGSSTNQGYTCPLQPEEMFFLRRQASSYCGTVYSDTLTVSVFSSYIDSVTVSVCQGDSFGYEGFEIPGGLSDNPGEYYFEHSYSSGLCDSVLVLHLKVNPAYEKQLQTTLCEGAGYYANGFHIPGNATVGMESMDSTLVLHSVDGCDSVVRLHLEFVDTTLYIVSMTENFCDEMMAELMVVTQFTDYTWNTGEQFPNITVTSPGTYTVTAEQDGCRVTAHIQVVGCELQVNLPNAISPSKADGLNDCFSIPEEVARQMNSFEISIFSRWGEMVYYSTDKSFRWNGDIKGKPAVDSVFNYIIHYTDTYGKPHLLTGSVTVL